MPRSRCARREGIDRPAAFCVRCRCFPFEGYNRKIKRWAKHSNMKDVLWHIGEMLMLDKAVHMKDDA